MSLGPDLPWGTEVLSGPPEVESGLQRALADAPGPLRVELASGHYQLLPTGYQDPTCGNCEEPLTPVQVTVGMVISGRDIEIVGTHADSVVIHTHAGYGLLFDGCDHCRLSGVTVTSGRRDADANATDAGVVVREGRVEIGECRIEENIGEAEVVRATVVGIAGVVGRVGSDIHLHDCQLRRNSWDGVALYRGARAEIVDNVIDGVDAARGEDIGGGRGVGIGVTWDAEARVEGNLVRNYWKGIGVFADARARIGHNVVENVLTWGIAYWGAEAGRPHGTIVDNAVFETGACGVLVDRQGDPDAEDPGALAGNLLVRTGQDDRYDSGEPYCPQRPIARVAVPQRFQIGGNLFFENRQPGAPSREIDASSQAAFVDRSFPVLVELASFPALRASRFLERFGQR